MSITVACSKCGATGRAADTSAGKRVKCRKCGTVMVVPSVSPVASVSGPKDRLTETTLNTPRPSYRHAQSTQASTRNADDQDEAEIAVKDEPFAGLAQQLKGSSRNKRRLIGTGVVVGLLIIGSLIYFLFLRDRHQKTDVLSGESAKLATSSADGTPRSTTEGHRIGEALPEHDYNGEARGIAQPLLDTLMRVESDLEVGTNYESYSEKVRDLNFQLRKIDLAFSDEQRGSYVAARLRETVEYHKKAMAWWKDEVENSTNKSMVIRFSSSREHCWREAGQDLKTIAAATAVTREPSFQDLGVLPRIKNFKAPPYPATGGITRETYDSRVADGSPVPKDFVDALVADLCMGDVLTRENVTSSDLLLALSSYKVIDWSETLGLRPWTHWNFVRSLNDREVESLARELTVHIRKNGVWNEGQK